MKRIARLLLVLAALAAARPSPGQQTGHEHHTRTDSTTAQDTTRTMPAHHHAHAPAGETGRSPAFMPGAVLPTVPMQRDGSGTSWLPDAAPMHAAHARQAGWDLMLHGSAFARYNAQDVFERGTRGDRQFDVPNWIMGMARRDVAPGRQLAIRGMLSLDPLTVGGSGYPLLFQTGESYQGAPLVDRQHPHDLFAELAVMYGHRLGENAGFFAYLGLPGEPALGPPAFMHRPSAQHNPDAPLGHHWQDATHIVFGVATLGFSVGPVKLDASVFTGREPDEERFGFDRPRFDSYSARVSYNPNERLALQLSSGLIKKPEHHEPDIDKLRTTASALYTVPAGHQGSWSSAFVWGYNEARSEHGAGEHAHGNQHSVLVESDLQRGPQTFYGRAEWVEKSPAEIAIELDEDVLGIGALTLGAARDVASAGGLVFTIGAQGTLYRVPEAIRPVYGAQPVSAQIHLRLAPARMSHGH